MNRRLLIVVTVVLAVAAVAAVFVIPRLVAPSNRGEASQFALDAQPRKGPADAPVDVVVFEDFLCPHCGTFAESVAPRLDREYVADGRIAYYAVNFVVIGPESERIAQVGECVFEQGNDAFWSFEQVAYRSQSGLDEQRAIELAHEYVDGLDRDALRSCIDENRGLESVRADGRRAQELGVTSTPTVFVSGQQVRAAYADVSAAIDAALAAGE